jgi:hypothetical protein
MSHFVNDDTVEIDVGDGESITIKQRMGIGDYDRIDHLRTSDEDGLIIATLLVNIKGWSYQEDGKPKPLTRENIQRLDPYISLKIFGEIGRLNNMSDTLKKVIRSMPKSGDS